VEKIYYDRGMVLRQLGVFHEPQSVLGQISVLATHPVTFARILLRKLVPSPLVSAKVEGNPHGRIVGIPDKCV
jgi:hypothetical protein